MLGYNVNYGALDVLLLHLYMHLYICIHYSISLIWKSA